MRARATYSSRQLIGWLFMLLAVLFLFGQLRTPERSAFISSEIAFTDPSDSGLQIMPASCASSPSYYHTSLAATGDGLGYVSANGQTEYGAYRNSVYICITNNTGVSFFVPANTAGEMNALKSAATGVPNLDVW